MTNVLNRMLVIGAAVMSLTTLPTFASTIELGISGNAELASNYLDFGQYPNGAPYTPAPGYGTFEVCLVNSGVFSTNGVTTGEFGFLQSLNEGVGAVTLPGPFMTFDSAGSNLQLWATYIRAGNIGPFVLTHTKDGAVASFNVEGYVFNTTLGQKVGLFTGTFSATLDGTSVTNFTKSLPIDTAFSATFTVTLLQVSTTPIMLTPLN